MSLDSNLQNFVTRTATELKSLRTLLNGNQANLSGLNTTTKTNLVAAINEVLGLIGDAGATIDDSATSASSVWSSSKTNSEIAAKVAALVDAAPGALDTLNELAAALGDDPNFAATINSALAGKQPLDTDLTAIAALTSAANKMAYATGSGTWALTDITAAARTLIAASTVAAMRTHLDVWSKAEIGAVDTNYVTLFESGLV